MARPAGRRDEIHATFIRHVAERGYELTNLGDIAGELGMSKGTIVHHFGTKAQMLRELEENYMRRQLSAVRRMWERLEAPQERIAAIVYASALLHVVDRDATVATQREVVQLADDPQMREVRKLRTEMQELTVAELRRGIESGVFREVDVELTTLQIWGSLQWMWVWFDPEGALRPEQVGASFVDLVLGGLLLDRLPVARLADPKGPIVTAVRECLEESTEVQGT
ncbi:TetR/AcrR family transcriptional regulator [Amycolatopsis anabasis]|uniref:TetR/AcrR family transcriptional regulator n=1 Tax=Amycolatopsis anabasis TaxID=1840409 RepID=UPI00131B0543|nr:TetR/AcrR family transcriptional regulator [Amycolatopsis anabasis]